MFDISVLGVPQLQRALNALPDDLEKGAIKNTLRKSALRLQTDVLLKISQRLEEHTGEYGDAWEAAKVKGIVRKNVVKVGIQYPTREALNIRPDDPYYYPFAIEYGHAAPGAGVYREGERVSTTATKHVPEYPHVRPAVDENREREIAFMARDLGREIKKAWKRHYSKTAIGKAHGAIEKATRGTRRSAARSLKRTGKSVRRSAKRSIKSARRTTKRTVKRARRSVKRTVKSTRRSLKRNVKSLRKSVKRNVKAARKRFRPSKKRRRRR